VREIEASVKVKFFPPEHGWMRIVLTYAGRDIPIHSSNVFDPYPALLDWLEKVFNHELPARWHITEEETYIDFIADIDESGTERLRLVGEQREDVYEDRTVYTFVDSPDVIGIAKEIYRSFKEMLDHEFEPKGWGRDLRALDWERIDKYLPFVG